jgi:phage-related tail protein
MEPDSFERLALRFQSGALWLVAATVLAWLTVRIVMSQRSARRAEPHLSAARRAGFALTDAINASGDVETRARDATRSVLAALRELEGAAPNLVESARGRVERHAAAAEAAAEQAAALARKIRQHHAEIMGAAKSSPLGFRLLQLAGSEAMEYRLCAEVEASSLEGISVEARRAAAEARAAHTRFRPE